MGVLQTRRNWQRCQELETTPSQSGSAKTVKPTITVIMVAI